MEHLNCACKKFSLGGPEENLNGLIDKESLRCLNEQVLGSVRKVFEEGNEQACVSSEGDPELLMNVIFSEPVNIKGVYFLSEKGKIFEQIFLYANQVNFSYDILNQKEDQSFEPHFGVDNQTMIHVNMLKFQRVNSISIYLKGNDQISLKYIRVVGSGTNMKRDVVRAQYEIVNVTKAGIVQSNRIAESS